MLALNIEVLNEVETTVGLTALRALKSLERHGPQQVSELGKDLTLNSSTASRLSDRLAGAGYITRRVSPTNRRATLLELTAEGQRVLDKLVSLRIQAFQSVVHRMTPEDIDALIRGARAFTEIERAPAESVSEHSSILEQ
ncbi:MarR family transcriptional regulator [Mycobacterium sp.]|uniref:MarR family winged helix-turn-helix transcriptional regulator n=1 Tax=Mycobacterium sp. TaxID=1785 RepID=UPI0031DF1F63